MPVREATGIWEGGLRDGSGTVKTGSGALDTPYNFPSRFEEGDTTNPEELIGAAHAACYSMALSAGLEKAGYPATQVKTTAKVHFTKLDVGFRITEITLITKAKVPNISEADFKEQAEGAKTGCPISNALSVEITLDAELIS